jgi:ATP-dependent Clp protease ATP-binding subunit ClpX
MNRVNKYLWWVGMCALSATGCTGCIPGSERPDVSNVSAETLTPIDIKNSLDEYIIGQDDAKQVLALAAHNHSQSIARISKGEVVTGNKSHVLLIGKTGTGKTLLVQTLARRVLQVPFCSVDATSLTASGYHGKCVSDIFTSLLANANYDIRAAEQGVIHIDEIDKLANTSGSRYHIHTQSVQEELLKVLEGSTVDISDYSTRRMLHLGARKVNTKNILFICSGAFSGLATTPDKGIARNTKKFLTQYGMMPELLGRLTNRVFLEPLSSDALEEILVKPKKFCIQNARRRF